jgi:GT2 family glycosyltransferase
MKFDISILVPTRGRPEKLYRLIESIGPYPNVEIIVGCDDDDDTMQQGPTHENVRFIHGLRHDTLGALFNTLAAEAQGDWLMAMGDDYVMETPDWPAIMLNCAKQMPRNVGVMFARDPHHPNFTTIFAIHRNTYSKVGYFVPPYFPYWFVDTWWDEIAEITGIKMEMPIDVSLPDGRGETQGLRDFPFWLQVFNYTRPMRVKDSLSLLKLAFEEGAGYPAQIIADLQNRQNHVRARVAHLNDLNKQAEIAKGVTGEPSLRYLKVKAEGEKLIEAMKSQQPRRLRVAVGVPSGRTWEAGTAIDIAGLCAFSTSHGVEIAILNMQTSMISNGRNGTVDLALKEGCDYILWVDSDMRFQPDTLLQLLKHEKDIVGATYNKRVPPYETLGKLKGDKPAVTGGGLHEALLLPGGMLLVKTDVYRKLEWPFYWESYSWLGEDGLVRFKKLLQDYFRDVPPQEVLDSLDDSPLGDWIKTNYTLGEYGEPFQYFSEDLNFCRKARKHGYQIWCDFDLTYQVRHIGVAEIPCKDPKTLTAHEKMQLVAAGFMLPTPEPVKEAAE